MGWRPADIFNEGDLVAQLCRVTAAAASSAASGANTSRPWKVALMSLTPYWTQARHVHADHLVDMPAGGQRRQQSIVRREDGLPVRQRDDEIARRTDTRIHHRDVHRARGKVAQGTRQPESSFDRLEGAHVMRHVDEAEL
jgi:hypothetical protein